MLAHAAALPAKRITLRAQYAPTGVVGAAYNASTFANATPLFTIAADRALISSHAARWKDDLAHGRTPHDVTLHPLGTFPQPQ
jgi:hypothetical protein